MPKGVLTSAGAEQSVRQHLTEADLLETVIGLPSNLFYATNLPACVLILRSSKDDRRNGQVRFVDASGFFVKGESRNELSSANQASIYAACVSDETLQDDVMAARLVRVEQISENGWDLNIGRYLQTARSVPRRLTVPRVSAPWGSFLTLPPPGGG